MSNILLILMGIFFIVPTIIYKQLFLTLTFCFFGLVFGLVEYAAYYYTGSTVTSHMLAFMRTNSKEGLIILICMGLGWLCLLLHLGISFK
jgi:hypothetical protein